MRWRILASPQAHSAQPRYTILPTRLAWQKSSGRAAAGHRTEMGDIGAGEMAILFSRNFAYLHGTPKRPLRNKLTRANCGVIRSSMRADRVTPLTSRRLPS